MPFQLALIAAIIALTLAMPSHAAVGPSFKPDSTFTGSTLDAWHEAGSGHWQASHGEISVTPKDNAHGALLISKRDFEDVGLFASFRCRQPCGAGLLVRLHKTAEGYRGILLSFGDTEVGAYNLTLDANGKEVERTKLRMAGGQIRMAPPPQPAASAPNRPPLRFSAPDGVTLPFSAPARVLNIGDWNQVEVLADASIVRAFVNDGGLQASGADDEAGDSLGQIALYVTGNNEVTFKDICYKDLSFKQWPAEKVSSHFRKQLLNPFFYGWSAAAADFNHDGVLDIVAGPYYYLGPDFTKSKEIYLAQAYNASVQYPNDCWVTHAHDFTGDGWPDVLTTSHSGRAGAVLYVNPRNESRRWKKIQVVPIVQTEATLLRDIDADGKPELVYAAEGFIRYAKPDPANPEGPWIVRSVSEKGPWSAHGIGVGDVNGDGRADILNGYGWWEQPAKGSGNELWNYHPQAFGRWSRSQPGGAEIAVFDVNGDGLNDVVTSLQAHGWGLAWFEQQRSPAKEVTFVQHMVMDGFDSKNAGDVTFSQLHGSAIADVDGDGLPDFIVGKRFWSHLDDFYDPDPYGAPVLYWYRTHRNTKAPGGAELIPELIHNRSGVGSDVLARDLNGDGVVDIVSATRLGTFVFWGTRSKQANANERSPIRKTAQTTKGSS